jgi:hypothetical protein
VKNAMISIFVFALSSFAHAQESEGPIARCKAQNISDTINISCVEAGIQMQQTAAILTLTLNYSGDGAQREVFTLPQEPHVHCSDWAQTNQSEIFERVYVNTERTYNGKPDSSDGLGVFLHKDSSTYLRGLLQNISYGAQPISFFCQKVK